MRASQAIIAGLLCAAACRSDSVAPIIAPQSRPVVSTPPADNVEAEPVGANIGHACTEDSECRAPGDAQCLDSIDPVDAIRGLIDAWLDFLPAEEDAGAQGPSALEQRVSAPGGYCSALCNRDEECGRERGCFSFEAELRARNLLTDEDAVTGGFVGEPGICLEPCDRDGDCRVQDGYVCRSPVQNLILIDGMSMLPIDPPFYCLPPSR